MSKKDRILTRANASHDGTKYLGQLIQTPKGIHLSISSVESTSEVKEVKEQRQRVVEVPELRLVRNADEKDAAFNTRDKKFRKSVNEFTQAREALEDKKERATSDAGKVKAQKEIDALKLDLPEGYETKEVLVQKEEKYTATIEVPVDGQELKEVKKLQLNFQPFPFQVVEILRNTVKTL